MDLQLAGKVAMVTAASRGLGKAAALALANEGADVALCARSETIFEAAEDIRQQTGAGVFPFQADLTEGEDITAFTAAVLDRFGQIDILIINAGGPPPGDFLSLTIKDWEDAVQLTLMSAVRLCYAVIPHMVERGSGSIVATESRSVRQPIDNLVLSNSVRLAVMGLLKSLANELGPEGIRVNAINPGLTRTARFDQLMQDRAERNGISIQQQIEKVAHGIPLQRVGTLKEYGRAVAWLASPAASYIHGHSLMFDGGITQFPL
jgi:3-oxoacyl-[acyl-carrier protein] reductase